MQATEPIAGKAIKAAPEGLGLLVGKRTILIPWEKCLKKPASATNRERMNAELSPGGYGMHWLLIGEDFYQSTAC